MMLKKALIILRMPILMSMKNRLLFRIFTTPVMENKRLSYVVQVASPLSQLHAVLRNLGFSLLFLLPLTVILTGLSGVFLVQLTLKAR